MLIPHLYHFKSTLSLYFSVTFRNKSQVRVRSLLYPLPKMTLWSIPEEILLLILRGLHIRDLLSLRSVSVPVVIHLKCWNFFYNFLLLSDQLVNIFTD